MRRLDITLVVLEVVLATGAFAGGGMLLLDPSGASMGMAVEVLQRSPFSTFMAPAIILIVAIGVLPALVATAALKRHPFDLLGHVVVGCVLTGWMLAQIVLIGLSAALQIGYLVLGLLILGLAALNLRR